MMKKESINLKLSLVLWLLIPILISSIYLLRITQVLSIDKPGQPVQNIRKEKIDVSDFVWDGRGLVTFWFDDAWLSQYKHGYRIMQKFGFKAALAVPTEHVGYELYMNWNHIRKLHFKGWEIISHTRNHDCELIEKSFLEAAKEILGGKIDLANQGIISDIYVPPCGITSEEIDRLVKTNFSAQRVVDPGLNPLPVNDKYYLKIRTIERNTSIDDVKIWINQAKYYNQWLIFMFHDINYENTHFGTEPEMLVKISEAVKNSGLQVVVPSEALSI